jgi:F-type H+-transporting ATPase subunit delta
VSGGVVAERYARAVFELGNETGQLAQLSDQIERFAEAFVASADLRAVLGNPVVPEERREALLKDIGARLGLSQNAVNAVRLMAARRRLAAISQVAAELRRLADEAAGIVRATVISAKPLPDSFYRELTTRLEQVTSKKILIEKTQDERLIAGVITKIGDRTIDGSLEGRLAAIERQLATAS